jgi:hypothetical protein
MESSEIVEESPVAWPHSDKEKFWEGLFNEIGKMAEILISQTKIQESVILPVSSKLKIPAQWWQPENRSATMKLIADVQGKIGEIIEFAVGPSDNIGSKTIQKCCNVCQWMHDVGFTQIKVSNDKVISLGGVLPNIFAAVHRAHESGLPALSTKDPELQRICGSYKHPSKAFDDLKHGEDYKILFFRRRGFISLRGAAGINPE